MAIFGVKGKVETQTHRLLDFQIRYTFNYGLQPCYRLYTDVTPPAGSNDDGVHLESAQRDLPEGDQQEHHFREAIQTLTRQFESSGLEATIRSFMRPKSSVNGVSGQERTGTGI